MYFNFFILTSYFYDEFGPCKFSQALIKVKVAIVFLESI